MISDNTIDSGYILPIIPLISLLFNLIIQTITYRFGSKRMLLASELTGFVSGLLIMLLLNGWLYIKSQLELKSLLPIFIANLISYLALSFWLVTLLGVISVSLRFRILFFLGRFQEGVSYGEIANFFNAEDLIERRLERLIKAGQIKLENNKYYIKKNFLFLIALFVDKCKETILGKRSEFD